MTASRFPPPGCGLGLSALWAAELADILAIQDGRQLQNDNTVRYKGLVLQIPEPGRPATLRQGQRPM